MGIREILNALRAGIVVIMILSIINITLDFVLYGYCTLNFKKQAQEYIYTYNGEPVPEFTIIDGELPD